MNRTTYTYTWIWLIIISAIHFSCKKALEVKSASDLQVPVSAADFQALLDNTNVISQNWPYAGIAGADESFVTDATWQSASVTERNAYIWDRNVFNDLPRNDWSLPYTTIFYANVVLEGVEQNSGGSSEWNNIQGQASFLRGYAYYQLAQEFCKPYDSNSAATDPGLVLRRSSNLNDKSLRSSVAQTYEAMIADLSKAVALLPLTAIIKTRPSKGAAYAMLARTYLAMASYPKAGLYADSSLQLNAALIDYNTIAPGNGSPFRRFNDEVLFHTISVPKTMLLPPRLLVDTNLYAAYENGDLRKTLFFRPAAGTQWFNFVGSYDGSANLFNGPATDEMYLIRAEAAARSGNVNAALADLNTLRKNRISTALYLPLEATSPTQALSLVLQERRKELLLRGLRWTDLKRLNKEQALAVTLKKEIDGKVYALPPNDPRYVWPIPQQVINDTGIAQN